MLETFVIFRVALGASLQVTSIMVDPQKDTSVPVEVVQSATRGQVKPRSCRDNSAVVTCGVR